MKASLRFCTCSDPISDSIRWAEDFWASHVEAVVPDGYLGAHADGGTMIRQVGYDKATLMREVFVDVEMTDDMYAKWLAGLRSKIGTPYDYAAILGFILRNVMHQKGHAICSAFQNWGFDNCKFWRGFSPEASYMLSPRDLYIRLSGNPDASLRGSA